MIKGIIDDEAKETAGLETNTENDDLISKMTNMSLHQTENNDSDGSDIEEEMKDNVLVSSNPIFNEEEASSKIKTVLEEVNKLKKIYEEDKSKPFEKAIIVSQWTSMLNVVRGHVKTLGLRVAEINGKWKITKSKSEFLLP